MLSKDFSAFYFFCSIIEEFPIQAMKMLDAEDLLIEIMLRLPPTSLLPFQCVSKQWLSIISSPDFRRLHSRRSAAVTGLFFVARKPTHVVNPFPGMPTLAVNPYPGPHFVSLQDEKRQHILANRLNELHGGGPIVSLSSCNGLLCVGFLDRNGFNSNRQFYVYNPTTNQRRRIPNPSYHVVKMDIAFDPSKSDHYKLVCIYNYKHSNQVGFSVFSSESRGWRDYGEQFLNEYFYNNNSCAAFLNGAIHWYCFQYRFVCFDVDNGRVRPMPCIPLFHRLKPGFHYFGEGGGHLHFIEECLPDPSMLLNVFEMENDYSQWVLKYQVDLSYVAKFYPILQHTYTISEDSAVDGFRLHLFEGKEGLVMSFPRKLILWHLHDMSITELAADIWPENFNDFVEILYCGYFTHKYFETLAFV